MMYQLVEQLKQSDQDFEFYPTSTEIIAALVRDLTKIREGRMREFSDFESRSMSVLDIGAGTGKVLAALRQATFLRYARDDEMRPLVDKLYAIEKSPILCERLPADVFILGTDFHEQSLVSKSVTVTFCNPPYSEFEQWAVKIIRESASPLVYLVIPTRWAKSVPIDDALKARSGEAQVIGEFTFEDAEDRAARAVVNLLRIDLQGARGAFQCFFDEHFADLKAKFESGAKAGADDEERRSARATEAQEAKFRQLVVGPNYPERLVELYNEEVDHVQRNYKLASELDVSLLKEFGISPKSIMEGLQKRQDGLKNTYWQELLGNLGSITNRLASKKRDSILKTLSAHGHVDFTIGNVHAIIVWVLKNANIYLDEQLVETFEQMVEKANVRNYKSNQRPFEYDRWRYNQEKPTHVALEYRIVLDRVGGISRSSYEPGLSQSAALFVGDLMTVAHNLGFLCETADQRLTRWGGSAKSWESGKVQVFGCHIGGKREPLIEVKAFLNGNLHVRMNQKFALALNVEYGRLKGWLKNGAQAAEELGDKEAPKYFGTHLKLGHGSVPLLAPAA